MNASNVKPLLLGVAAGAVLCAVVGFQGLGWVLGSTAEEMAESAVNDTTVALLAPACVANGLANEAKLAEIMAESSYKRRGLVEKTGWSAYPDGASSKLKRMMDDACLKGLTAAS
jgi:hypothetical protein